MLRQEPMFVYLFTILVDFALDVYHEQNTLSLAKYAQINVQRKIHQIAKIPRFQLQERQHIAF